MWHQFGRSLIDQLGPGAPPIGLIQSAIGGTTIEAWSSNTTTTSCANRTMGAPSAGKPNGRLYYGMVCPFVNTTIAGFAWYQVSWLTPCRGTSTHPQNTVHCLLWNCPGYP